MCVFVCVMVAGLQEGAHGCTTHSGLAGALQSAQSHFLLARTCPVTHSATSRAALREICRSPKVSLERKGHHGMGKVGNMCNMCFISYVMHRCSLQLYRCWIFWATRSQKWNF